ncbi:transporter substrate-binding domain-containing protein [Desulfovibrio subterraneus]|uniref:substrate-binding periplasmic protein n=1 Tax=Desulfovibrio subterraneus TaxID=2718620 RepID=UPI0022B91E62|nr:transporter substrate-binding domain-containing protein [Desulfovibrio subterraneus]WBF66134.1 transporter substrate-binding domain-containing protein [Desulfovibrio subterraneus]
MLRAAIIIFLLTCLPAMAGSYRISAFDMETAQALGPIVKEAYRRIGADIELVTLPGERALVMANRGDVDGELARVPLIGKLYPNLLPVPVPLGSYDGVVFAHDFVPPVQSWEDLRKYRIGVEIGVKFAETGTKGMDVVLFGDRRKMFEMLELGRIDVVVHLRETGEAELRALGLKDVHAQEKPLTTLVMYHYVHRRHADIIPQLAKALEEMKQDGTLAALHRKAGEQQ